MARRISVRRAKSDGRMMRTQQAYDIVFAGTILAKIQESRDNGKWYWYSLAGPAANTSQNPRDFETVKAEALACCRTYLAGRAALQSDGGAK